MRGIFWTAGVCLHLSISPAVVYSPMCSISLQPVIFNTVIIGSIQVVEIDNNPWFVGKDIAESLGYVDIKKAVRVHVDNEDKGVADLSTPGGKQKTVIINESGLYSLIMSSKLPTSMKMTVFL